MTEMHRILIDWHRSGKTFAIARVVTTWGSAPRSPGSIMLISADLEIAGSVSGGCIEGSVIETAKTVMRSGRAELREFGVDNETAWSVGLSCGGRVEVLVESWSTVAAGMDADRFVSALLSEKPCVLVTELGDDPGKQTLFFPASDVGAGSDAQGSVGEEVLMRAVSSRQSSTVQERDRRYFVHVFSSRRRLLVIGGSDITISLLSMAALLDFETTVIDPRGVFVQPDRFPTPPDHVYEAWPQEIMPGLTLDENTFAVLLTHDPKIDDPALHILLAHPVAYIGALGGRKTQEKRRQRLAEAGFSAGQVDRIRGPVGIDIEAATPPEIALSIMAEIIAVKNRRAALVKEPT